MSDTWNRIWDQRGREYPEDDAAKIAGYDRAFSTMTSEAADRLADVVAGQLGLRPTDALLDVGCGAGMLLARLAPRVREAWGTDRAAGMVERTQRLYPGLQVRCAEARALPFPDASFEKVLLHGVAQYFPDLQHATEALDELVRVMKPGGRIVICDKSGTFRCRLGLQTFSTDPEAPDAPITLTGTGTGTGVISTVSKNFVDFDPTAANNGVIDTKAGYRLGLLYSSTDATVSRGDVLIELWVDA